MLAILSSGSFRPLSYICTAEPIYGSRTAFFLRGTAVSVSHSFCSLPSDSGHKTQIRPKWVSVLSGIVHRQSGSIMASSSPPRPDTPHGRPQILQPVPRRPFDLDLSLTTPTPPAAEPTSPSGPSQDLDLDLLDSRLAAAGSSVQATAGGVEPGGLLNPASGGNIASDSLSRARSLVDLTSSTLFGIYAAASSASISGLAGSSSQQQHNSRPQEQPDAVADTDEAGDRELVAVMRERRSFGEASGAATAELRRLRTLREDSTGTLRRRTALFASNLRLLAPRAALLFVLGLGYGVLLVEGLRGRQGESTSRRADENDGSSREPTAETPSWDFLVFWGIAGVLLGAALPWFDGVWDAMSAGAAASRHKPAAVVEETDQEIETSFRGKQGLCPSSKNHEPVISGAPAAATAGTDWFGAMRAAGTFLGVCFAIVSLSLRFIFSFTYFISFSFISHFFNYTMLTTHLYSVSSPGHQPSRSPRRLPLPIRHSGTSSTARSPASCSRRPSDSPAPRPCCFSVGLTSSCPHLQRSEAAALVVTPLPARVAAPVTRLRLRLTCRHQHPGRWRTWASVQLVSVPAAAPLPRLSSPACGCSRCSSAAASASGTLAGDSPRTAVLRGAVA